MSGDASWKRVVVSIILDGLDPADKAVLECVKTGRSRGQCMSRR